MTIHPLAALGIVVFVPIITFVLTMAALVWVLS